MKRALAGDAILGTLAPAAAPASGGRAVARCSQQSQASFPRAFSDPAIA
jgi:hypothetical protein